MVRGGNGRLVAATIALLERQSQEQNRNDQSQPVRTGAKESDSESKEMIESSMDGSTIKSNSSTDSGKDDQSIITSNSSTTSNSNEALDTICCKDDFQWVGQQHKPQIGEGDAKSETRSRDMKRDCGGCSSRGGGEVRLRKTSASLDRKKASRRERDAKSKSTSGFHKSPGHRDCCSRDFSYCDYVDRIPPPHDFRIPYYYRPPPLPCDYPFRCVHKVPAVYTEF
ncbi:unnamed protein product [Nesidiocoris tenuis]|uniref:Uncharacterized protein n=1 Tax=Nesidiocoris tenuis TaxID=355587 RepID=A0A6H5H9M9_9HEMI|nr:unnamed protein product [Nesidiocoris tenuis]